jgi:hypothetical protein
MLAQTCLRGLMHLWQRQRRGSVALHIAHPSEPARSPRVLSSTAQPRTLADRKLRIHLSGAGIVGLAARTRRAFPDLGVRKAVTVGPSRGLLIQMRSGSRGNGSLVRQLVAEGVLR